MNTDQMKSNLLLFALLLIFSSSPLLAQGFDYNDIGITVKTNEPSTSQGEAGTINITFNCPFGYSITDAEGVFEIVALNEIDGISFGELDKPRHDIVDDIGGHFEGVSEFKLHFTIDPDLAPGEYELSFGFRLQACDTISGMCFMATDPEDYKRGVTIVVDSQSGGSTAASSATSGENGDSWEEKFKGALDSGNLWLVLLLAFVAGILSSLTPCVYPMIPITISFVSGKAEGKKRNGFFISLVLVLGIAITYSILGVASALLGATFGTMMTHWAVNLFVAAVFIALGFSMLGAFEIALPASLTSKMHRSKSGYGSALFVGLTIGLIAAPCVAPILVMILTWIATTQNLLVGLLLMFTYAIGMGILFIFIGTFSNAILPKSGMWMEWMKKIFAFVFFIMAVIYSQSLINNIYPDLHLYILGVLLVILGAVMGAFFRLDKEAGWGPILGKSLGLLIVIAGVILFASGLVKMFIPLGSTNLTKSETVEAKTFPTPAWITDFEAGLELAASSGKPLLVDIGADWCVACHELDEFTFSDSRVIAELERFVIVKVDGTNENDPLYQKVKKHFSEKNQLIVGLPAVFIHNSEGEIVDRVNQFIDAKAMLAKLTPVQ